MTYIAKPIARHPALQKNDIGLTRRDYEGAMTTLCAGCGHDSITAAIIQAFWELSIEPYRVAKLSGIGCSSRIPYFISTYGFHGIHGRTMPIATGVRVARPRPGISWSRAEISRNASAQREMESTIIATRYPMSR